jgi:hypothetical protein
VTDGNSATIVSVADGGTTAGIDATMAEPQSIVGRTTNPGGAPIDGICVSVHPYNTTDPYGPPAGFAQTDEDGYYVIPLPTGQYKVQFFDQGGPCAIGQYAEQWYRDKPNFASADTVQVLPGRATFDIDAVMYEEATLGGHVQDEAAQPLLGICVVANNQTTLNMPGVVPPFARTDAAGNYEMENIPPGDWMVQFYDGGFPCNVGKYVLQFFNGKPTPELADLVHVARGAHVTGINATMKLFVAPVVTTQVTPPPPPPPPPVVKCRIPTLRGVTLARAKRLLKAKHCRLGKVTRKRASRKFVGRVLASKPRAHSLRANGTKVALVLGKRR